MKIKKEFLTEKEYLFPKMQERINVYKKENSSAKLINLGIGDVVLPLPEVVSSAMQKASLEMSDKNAFKGYGNELGYDFLREKISKFLGDKGLSFTKDEIVISDGIATDLYLISSLFVKNSTAVVPNPSYPEYKEICTFNGFRVKEVYALEDNGFLPMPNYSVKADIIFLCSPCNPTGLSYDKKQLEVWVDYAIRCSAIIIFDSAYNFFTEKNKPFSIYEIQGAKSCVIEVCSFSKNAGFTGIRCGYTILPNELCQIRSAFIRLKQTATNGVSYVTQRGAEASLSKDGLKQICKNIKYYKKNSNVIKKTLSQKKVFFVGEYPYVYMKIPSGFTSWQYFEFLLSLGVIVTPAVGFGSKGENFVRISSFCSTIDARLGSKIIAKTYNL